MDTDSSNIAVKTTRTIQALLIPQILSLGNTHFIRLERHSNNVYFRLRAVFRLKPVQL
jgi:hypothetical protein